MPDELFRYWTERTTDSNQPPNVNRLIETLHYRLGLQGRTDDAPDKCRLSPQSKKKPCGSGALHVQKDRDCQLCHGGNHPYLCSTFKGLSVEENNTASRLKVCTNCLSFTHFFRNCPSSRSCPNCGKKHHSLLHRQRSAPSSGENSATRETPTKSTSAHISPNRNNAQGKARIFLGTCQVTLESGGRKQKARALLDGGSPISFITSKMTNVLRPEK